MALDITGPENQLVRLLEGVYLIGRRIEDNNTVITGKINQQDFGPIIIAEGHQSISRAHLAITIADDVILYDRSIKKGIRETLGSYLDGKQFQIQKVKEGDHTLTLGSVDFKVSYKPNK